MPAYVLQLLAVLPQLISSGRDVIGLVQHATETARRMHDEKRDPTPQEWDELNARIGALQTELHAPGT